MNKTKKIVFSLLIVSVLLVFDSLHAIEKQPFQQQKSTESTFLNFLDNQVLETIKYSNDIPGLMSEDFFSLKTEISRIWSILLKDGILELRGNDKDIRPYFVSLQAVIEHILASELHQNVKTLKGFIHTPMPATPLCSRGEISKELVDSSMELDPVRLFTVKARTTIVRDYLFKGGDLYIVYPKCGYEKRSEEQKTIYQQELMNYPHHLFDIPLNCENMPSELIGATYLFQDCFGNNFVFSINITQAKGPKDFSNFGLWFGPIDHPAIQKRLQALSDYLEQNDVKLLEFKSDKKN